MLSIKSVLKLPLNNLRCVSPVSHLQPRAQRIRLPGRCYSKVAERRQHRHCLRWSFLLLYFSARFFLLPSANLSFSIQQSISAEEIKWPGAHTSWGMGAPGEVRAIGLTRAVISGIELLFYSWQTNNHCVTESLELLWETTRKTLVVISH